MKGIQRIQLINSLNHGNYLAYGLAATALWVLGIPHAFAVMHGKTRKGALVFDVADLIKDAVVLPLSFVCAKLNFTEQNYREQCVLSFTNHKVLDFQHDERGRAQAGLGERQMMVLFQSECDKNALKKTRRILDSFANRTGRRSWQTVITQEGLEAVKKLLKRAASKDFSSVSLDTWEKTLGTALGSGKSRQVQQRRIHTGKHHEKKRLSNERRDCMVLSARYKGTHGDGRLVSLTGAKRPPYFRKNCERNLRKVILYAMSGFPFYCFSRLSSCMKHKTIRTG